MVKFDYPNWQFSTSLAKLFNLPKKFEYHALVCQKYDFEIFAHKFKGIKFLKFGSNSDVTQRPRIKNIIREYLKSKLDSKSIFLD